VNGERSKRMLLLVSGCTILILALGVGGFALGRSARTSKAQAMTAERIAMTHAFNSSFRAAFRVGDRSGFGRGLPEGEGLGRVRGGERGRQRGDVIRHRRLLRRAALLRRRASRRGARRPAAHALEAQRRASHRRKAHRPTHPRRERESAGEVSERESQAVAGAEAEGEGF
jgi:hypothetical protein